MDPVRTANIRAFVDGKTKDIGPGNKEVTYEKKQLSECRVQRLGMRFIERMEADAECKQAYSQVTDMRANLNQGKALDKIVLGMRPAPELKGPKIVCHDGRSLFQG
eukprot:TRINITY_DN50102_c0_g1_i1.p2 TRINITY_DN50102_c0_g1~~TRINITY_DN50102_c0_g1_i1.p2  ORF type:complete len:124 (-),score=28.51 TRINITY_DN50102_c0_g1_i1:111-428(-)